jgi:hypothetical protein
MIFQIISCKVLEGSEVDIISVSFDSNSCIESVGFGWNLRHFLQQLLLGEGLCNSNLKTNGDIKKGLKRKKLSPKDCFLSRNVSKWHPDKDRVVEIKQE